MSFEIDKFHPLNNVSLPKGSITNLRGIVKQIEPGFACGQHNSEGIGVIHLRPYNINSDGNLVFAEDKFVPADFSNKRTKINDVFFNNTNSPELVGKTSLIEGKFANQAFSNHMYRIELLGLAEPKFVAMQLHFLFLYGYFKHKCTSHVNQASISQNELLDNTAIFLPDIEKQRKIISLIDKKVAQIEHGSNSLEQAEKQLELYRQSVLKEAFEGKLTADWRVANPDKVESADKLLGRIEAERKSAHQAELDAWKDAVKQWESIGKEGRKPSKPKAFISGSTTVTEGTIDSQLPATWGIASINKVASVGTGSTPLKSEKKFYQGGTIPWVTSSAVNQDPVNDYDNMITEFALEKTNVSICPAGTLLMAMYGEGKTRGKVAELNFASTTNQAVATITFLNEHKIVKCFTKNFLKFNYEKNRRVSVGGVQPNLNLAKVKAIEVPICGIAEMEQINTAVEKLNLEISRTLKSIEQQRVAVELLKQSILKQAFSGCELRKDAS